MKKRKKRRSASRPKCRGAHVQDNQGRCHQCGVLMDRDAWEAYAGKGTSP